MSSDWLNDGLSMPMSPIDVEIKNDNDVIPTVTPSDGSGSLNVGTEMFEQFVDDPFFFDPLSNDFNSSVGIARVVKQQPELQYPFSPRPAPIAVPTPKVTNPIQITPTTMEACSPAPIMKKFVLEPEVFKIKTKRKQTPRLLQPKPEDEAFFALCQNQAAKIYPHGLGFIPAAYWPDQVFSFGDVLEDYFRLKNNPNARFPCKLYNALKLTTNMPEYIPYVGIQWLNDTVIRVDTAIYGRFNKLQHVNGALFHSQGNFPSHGFIEIKSMSDALSKVDEALLTGVDFDSVRLLYHQSGQFTRNSVESDIIDVKWIPVGAR